MNGKPAFTLSELLIALAILGVVSAFTIPKIIQAQQNYHYNALSKEMMGAYNGIFQILRQQNMLHPRSSVADMMPFLNATPATSTTRIDNVPMGITPFGPGPILTCSDASHRCVQFANGAVMMYAENAYFGVSSFSERSGLPIIIDPDGQATGTPSVCIFQYQTGVMRSYGTVLGNTATRPTIYVVREGETLLLVKIFGTSPATHDPPWFEW